MSFAGTWMASPGKGSHGVVGGGTPVAFRSVSATTYASRTNTTITAPSGIVNGDILLLLILTGGASPATATLPAGFTALVTDSVSDGSFTVNRILAWKVASSESGDYTCTHAAGSSQGAIVCVSDGNTGVTPTFSNNEGSGGTTTALGITTPSDAALVVFFVHNWGDAASGFASPPAGTTPTFTQRFDYTAGTGLIYVATGVLATAGATGDKTQNNGGVAGSAWAGMLIGIKD